MSARTILHIEDDIGDAYFVQRAFTKAKAPVSVKLAQDGAQGLAYLKGEGAFADRKEYPLPDLILLDLKMPKVNGYEVLEWIRKQEHLKKLPVIVLTSSALNFDAKRVQELGASEFLTKSPTCDHVPAAVLRHLPAQQGWG